ncbi:putative F-box/kelch-repeat protein [Raphanus sativus]|uniref:F-box protein At2g02030 n=1 Tax=Raphanus sativus TaxID=3726 RepID=A0A9W3DUA5_RAPSA|nr:putative F-box protein At2g02030 [Raphanus sativus]KAJ4895964.1 putative F-box/kelch-repeat protein [Raphanus sativus]
MEGKRKRGVNIPRDIVEEILVKVPVKSLVRFKVVSKEWRRSIESTCFIEKHIRYQKSLGGATVLSTGKKRRNSLVLEKLLITPCSGSIQTCQYLPIQPFRPTYDFKVSEPCDGLFCIYTKTNDRKFNLVNPATNSRRILPEATSTLDEVYGTSYSLLGIGRENVVIPKHKLLWFFQCNDKLVNEFTRCKVLSLDSNSWRYVDPPNCRIYCDQPIIHLDGVLYCFSFNREEMGYGQPCICKLLAFDLHTEMFHSFSTQDLESRDCRELSMCILNHRPCIFKKRLGNNDLLFKIWGLDINKSSWEVMYSIEFSCFPPEFYNRFIIPVATINDHVILSNSRRDIWVFYGSKTHIFPYKFTASKYHMSFFETLVSVYQ